VFSGDGQSIAYRFTPDSAGKWLCIANADGSGARLLARGPVYYYALSPDGKKLAFCEWPEEGTQFCVINADGTGWRLLSKGYHDVDPAFSPDGKKIIYESGVPRGSFEVSDIYIINADGSERRALTRTPGDERGARFTPDGSKIVFVARPPAEDDDAESGIYVMNANGAGRRRLAAGGDFSLGPSLVEGRLLDSYGNWHDVVEDPEATPAGE
jgi:TolB protein